LQSCYHLSRRRSIVHKKPPNQPLTFWSLKWEGGVIRRWSCEASRGIRISLWGCLSVSSF